MKKLICILIVVLLTLSFVACNSQTNSTDGDKQKPVGKIKADVLCDDDHYEFVWEEKDATNGVLIVSECMTATADEIASVGLSGTLTAKESLTYNVTYSKGTDGVYVAEGAVASAAMSIEGECADEYIKKVKESLEDSKLDILTGRVLDGEVLTNKEDIEDFIGEDDKKVKVTFTVENGKMVVSEYVDNYIRGERIKEVYHIENDVTRSCEEYESDELVRKLTYRENGNTEKIEDFREGKLKYAEYYDENGNIERTDYYTNGELTSTEYYDENGNII